jgi:hypothetical protein
MYERIKGLPFSPTVAVRCHSAAVSLTRREKYEERKAQRNKTISKEEGIKNKRNDIK